MNVFVLSRKKYLAQSIWQYNKIGYNKIKQMFLSKSPVCSCFCSGITFNNIFPVQFPIDRLMCIVTFAAQRNQYQLI